MTRLTTSDLPKEAIAFLDAVAIGESGGADDDAAYSILFGGSHFDISEGWPASFPQWAGIWVGGLPTHAAGRYQFEPATWRGLGDGSFDPAHQDAMAWKLAQQSMAQLLVELQNQELQWVAKRLNSQWSSLSPMTFPARYVTCLGKLS